MIKIQLKDFIIVFDYYIHESKKNIHFISLDFKSFIW